MSSSLSCAAQGLESRLPIVPDLRRCRWAPREHDHVADRERPHPFVVAMTRALRYVRLRYVRLSFVRRAIAGTAARNKPDIETMNELVDEVIGARRPGEGDDLLARVLDNPHPVTGQRLDPVTFATR
jgi:hypothetical protein